MAPVDLDPGPPIVCRLDDAALTKELQHLCLAGIGGQASDVHARVLLQIEPIRLQQQYQRWAMNVRLAMIVLALRNRFIPPTCLARCPSMVSTGLHHILLCKNRSNLCHSIPWQSSDASCLHEMLTCSIRNCTLRMIYAQI